MGIERGGTREMGFWMKKFFYRVLVGREREREADGIEVL